MVQKRRLYSMSFEAEKIKLMDNEKIKTKVVFVGQSIEGLRKKRVLRWKSMFFSVDVDNRKFSLGQGGEIDIIGYGFYGYSDRHLEKILPQRRQIDGENHDLIFYVLDVPLENNHFSRIISDNRIVISFYQIKDILQRENIPLENHIISLIYTYVLLFKTISSESTLSMKDEDTFAHDGISGCLYDMCLDKNDVIHSCLSPKICHDCCAKLIRKGISVDDVNSISSEMEHIKRDCYYKVERFLKLNPILNLVITSLIAVVLSVLANVIFELIK